MSIRTTRRAMSLAASMLAWMHAWSSPTYAGPVDTPLPTFSDGTRPNSRPPLRG
jgi:hypothetical protein